MPPTHRFALGLMILILGSALAVAQPWTDCQVQDTIFILDSSGSVGQYNWETMTQGTADAIRAYDPDNPFIRFGVIQFASYAARRWDFWNNPDRELLASYVEGLSFSGGATWTRTAFEEAIDMFDETLPGGGEKLIILISDGEPYPHHQDPCPIAYQLFDRDIRTLVIGIGDYWYPERLECLVQDPDADMIHIDDFDGLLGAFDYLSEVFCVESVATESADWGLVKTLY